MRLTLIAALLVIGATGFAKAEEAKPSRVFPRLTLVELQYPQGVAASGGMWVRFDESPRRVLGAVGDLGVGLSGATVTLGVGTSAPDRTSYEQVWSIGFQGIAHRTWPWWSPWLPVSSTFAGGQVFAAYFAVRCSAGAMWPTTSRPSSSWTVIGGCGIGLP